MPPTAGGAGDAAYGTSATGPHGHAPPEKVQVEAHPKESVLPYTILKDTKLCQMQPAKQPADPPSSLLVDCLGLHLHFFQHHLNPAEPAQPGNKQAKGTDCSGW